MLQLNAAYVILNIASKDIWRYFVPNKGD